MDQRTLSIKLLVSSLACISFYLLEETSGRFKKKKKLLLKEIGSDIPRTAGAHTHTHAHTLREIDESSPLVAETLQPKSISNRSEGDRRVHLNFLCRFTHAWEKKKKKKKLKQNRSVFKQPYKQISAFRHFISHKLKRSESLSNKPKYKWRISADYCQNKSCMCGDRTQWVE